jgi:hypothetical protein
MEELGYMTADFVERLSRYPFCFLGDLEYRAGMVEPMD